MNSEIDRTVADAIKPLNQKLRELERKLEDVERQLKMHEKTFSDFLKRTNPRNR